MKRLNLKYFSGQTCLMMPKSLVSCTVLTCSRQNLLNRNKKKTLQRVPVQYRPNTLRRLSQREFLQLQSARVGKITRTLICEGFRVFYSSVELTLISWWRGYFLVEKILINTRNLRDPFLIGIPSIVVGCRVQDISILGFLETIHATKVTRRCHEGDKWLQQIVSLRSVFLKESNHHISSSSML